MSCFIGGWNKIKVILLIICCSPWLSGCIVDHFSRIKGTTFALVSPSPSSKTSEIKRKELPGVTIRLYRYYGKTRDPDPLYQITGTSDDSGGYRYLLQDKFRKFYVVEFSKPGYKTKEVPVTITDKQTDPFIEVKPCENEEPLPCKVISVILVPQEN